MSIVEDCVYTAVEQGRLDIVKKLVNQGKSVRDLEDYCFRIACRNNDLQMVKYLYSLGVDSEVLEHCIQTASAYGYSGIVKFLTKQK